MCDAIRLKRESLDVWGRIVKFNWTENKILTDLTSDFTLSYLLRNYYLSIFGMILKETIHNYEKAIKLLFLFPIMSAWDHIVFSYFNQNNTSQWSKCTSRRTLLSSMKPAATLTCSNVKHINEKLLIRFLKMQSILIKSTAHRTS